jgi:hypothetical protein
MNTSSFDLPASFWLNRELSKVKDPKRRAFLERIFSKPEGYQKFIWLMIRRHGAVEFVNGTWAKKLPRLSKTELIQNRFQRCLACGKLVKKIKSPWGEIIENDKPVCETCKKDIYEYNARKERAR